MKRLCFSFLLLLTLIFSGCAQIAAKREINSQALACRQQLQTDPALNPLRGKLILLDPDQATIAMLDDSSRANSEEQIAILAFDKIKIACVTPIITRLALLYPAGVVAAFQDRVRIAQNNRADLYSGRITFGEANRRSQENTTALNKELAELNAKYESIAAMGTAAYAAARSANTQTWQSNQPLVPAPLSTMCYRTGIFTNCTTH